MEPDWPAFWALNTSPGSHCAPIWTHYTLAEGADTLSYVSMMPNVAHVCGDDAYIAILLATVVALVSV